MTIKFQKGKGKPQIARPEDALAFLHRALKAPSNSEERQALLDWTLLTYCLGLVNWQKNLIGDRRGRPKGTTGGQHHRHPNDADALRLMAQIANDTGELRPYTLARLAISKGPALPARTKEKTVRRLARRWKSLTAKK